MRWRAWTSVVAGAAVLATGLVAAWPMIGASAPRPGSVQPLVVRDVPNGETVVFESVQPGPQVGVVGRVTVRLLGVDAPDPGNPNECYAIPSRAALSALLPVGTLAWVLVEQAPTAEDATWRAWVWDGEGRLVNAVLAQSGFVRVGDPPRDEQFWTLVAQSAEQAARRGAGLWGECRTP